MFYCRVYPAMTMEEMGLEPAPMQNIAEIIISTPQHSTPQSAVRLAGLTEILSGEGPFTVFAPTNDAFGYNPKVSRLTQPTLGANNVDRYIYRDWWFILDWTGLLAVFDKGY